MFLVSKDKRNSIKFRPKYEKMVKNTNSIECFLPFYTKNITFVDRFFLSPWFQTFLDNIAIKKDSKSNFCVILTQKTSLTTSIRLTT